ncbi:MAG TPA: S8 family serine peptidase, partial [Longimicrobium sp.]|nr:S8 family serine peptidase [Longimicrobium sp.]
MDILRAVLGSAQSAVPSALPPDELRFVLEYREPPDLDAERRAIAAALGSEAFVLLPLFEGDAPDLGRFVVLRFPGVERTLSQETLFQVAYALADLRGLASAEPDLGTPTFADPAPRMDGPQGESTDVFGLNCWVDADPPEDRRWVLRTTGVLRAWERFGSRGAGVLIAQPDTGVVAHDELDPASLRLDLAADILGGDADPTDPLRPGTANPGHGTSTASVVVSRLAGDLAGPAPEALLVPIRCIEDVKVFDASPVARAIEHATRARCDVITMSLG